MRLNRGQCHIESLLYYDLLPVFLLTGPHVAMNQTCNSILAPAGPGMYLNSLHRIAIHIEWQVNVSRWYLPEHPMECAMISHHSTYSTNGATLHLRFFLRVCAVLL